MTGFDFYAVCVWGSGLGLVVLAGWRVVTRGPEWYRRKRAAAVEFQREARIRAMR